MRLRSSSIVIGYTLVYALRKSSQLAINRWVAKRHLITSSSIYNRYQVITSVLWRVQRMCCVDFSYLKLIGDSTVCYVRLLWLKPASWVFPWVGLLFLYYLLANHLIVIFTDLWLLWCADSTTARKSQVLRVLNSTNILHLCVCLCIF